MKFNKDEIKFLKENYPDKGTEYCANKLNRTKNSVSRKATRLGLKISQKRKIEVCVKNGSKIILLI